MTVDFGDGDRESFQILNNSTSLEKFYKRTGIFTVSAYNYNKMLFKSYTVEGKY